MHTRVTRITADATGSNLLRAGVEIDGIYRSRDAGRTRQSIDSGLCSRDIHAIVTVSRCLLAATNNDLNLSDDDGDTWRPSDIGSQLSWSYCRGMSQSIGQPEVLFLGDSDGPPETAGIVAYSEDGGSHWRAAAMPGQSNSTMWNFAVHPAMPSRVYAASVSGELYRSEDGGKIRRKPAREFGEVRALARAP